MRERTQFWNTRWANQTGEKTLRYAIVGGTGMIGSWLAGHLRARGDHVWILTRQSPRGEDEIQWHPSRGIQSVGRLEGLDAVFNLSGAHIADRPWTSNRRQLLMESRVGATAVLLESFAKLDEPPKAYVGVSHIGLFGDKGDVFIEDDDPPGGGFLSDLCVCKLLEFGSFCLLVFQPLMVLGRFVFCLAHLLLLVGACGTNLLVPG